MRALILVATVSFCGVAIGQSLSIAAVSSPAVNGNASFAFAGSDAFYLAGSGPSGLTTVSRWRATEGLQVIGTAPDLPFSGAPSFASAVELNGWIYFGSGIGNTAGGCFPITGASQAKGGIWKCPTTGTGPVTLASANWHCTFGNGVTQSAMATDGTSVWFLSQSNVGRLGQLDPVTGAVTDHGTPFGVVFYGIAADAGNVYCIGHFASATDQAVIYRFETAAQSFSLMTLFQPVTYAVASSFAVAGPDLVGVMTQPGGHHFVRINRTNGVVLEMPPASVDHAFAGPLSAFGTSLDFIASANGPGFGAVHIATRDASGNESTLVPAPCLLETGPSADSLCDVRAFLRDGSLIHVATQGTSGFGLSAYFAVATFSPSPVLASSASVEAGCVGPGFPVLSSTAPVLGSFATLSLLGSAASPGYLVGGNAPAFPLSIDGCAVLVDLSNVGLYPIATTAAGTWTGSIFCPPALLLMVGAKQRWQTAMFVAGGVQLSNGVEWTFGF